MQEVPQSFIEWIVAGIGTTLLAFAAYFSKKTIDNIDAAGEAAAQNALELEKYKTHVSDNYAKSSTLERVHERIDAVNEGINEILSKMANK